MSKKKDKPEFETNESQELVPVSANVGQSLIKEALGDMEDKQRKRVVQKVADIMERAHLMKRILSKTQKRIDLLDKQLAALNEGQFKIVDTSFSGVPGWLQMEYGIKFNDADLNIDWSATERW